MQYLDYSKLGSNSKKELHWSNMAAKPELDIEIKKEKVTDWTLSMNRGLATPCKSEVNHIYRITNWVLYFSPELQLMTWLYGMILE